MNALNALLIIIVNNNLILILMDNAFAKKHIMMI